MSTLDACPPAGVALPALVQAAQGGRRRALRQRWQRTSQLPREPGPCLRLCGELEDPIHAAGLPWAAAAGWVLLGVLFDASLLLAAGAYDVPAGQANVAAGA